MLGNRNPGEDKAVRCVAILARPVRDADLLRENRGLSDDLLCYLQTELRDVSI